MNAFILFLLVLCSVNITNNNNTNANLDPWWVEIQLNIFSTFKWPTNGLHEKLIVTKRLWLCVYIF